MGMMVKKGVENVKIEGIVEKVKMRGEGGDE